MHFPGVSRLLYIPLAGASPLAPSRLIIMLSMKSKIPFFLHQNQILSSSKLTNVSNLLLSTEYLPFKNSSLNPLPLYSTLSTTTPSSTHYQSRNLHFPPPPSRRAHTTKLHALHPMSRSPSPNPNPSPTSGFLHTTFPSNDSEGSQAIQS